MAQAETSQAALRNQIAEVLMEHFGFVPQAFSRRASDLSNEVLYSTMDSIEKVVKDRLGSSEDVEKGLYTLETLLENQIDMRLDQYEAYLHRNVFMVQPDLLPYIKLDHQTESLARDSGVPLEGEDEKLLQQIADERTALNEEMEKHLDLEAASERFNNRALALGAVEEALEELGWGISQDPEAILKRLDAVESQLPIFMQDLNNLESSKPPGLSPQSGSQPWTSRESYVQWATQKKAQESGHPSFRGYSEQLAQQSRTSGTQEDAESLLRLLKGQQ